MPGYMEITRTDAIACAVQHLIELTAATPHTEKARAKAVADTVRLLLNAPDEELAAVLENMDDERARRQLGPLTGRSGGYLLKIVPSYHSGHPSKYTH
jgi:hypothetical protein